MADRQQLTFAIKIVLNTWDTLRLAITHGFSGRDNDDEILDNLVNDILDNLLDYSLPLYTRAPILYFLCLILFRY